MKNKLLLLFTLLLIAFLGFFVAKSFSNNQVYVEISTLFNEFTLTKKIENDFQSIKLQRDLVLEQHRSILDSLKLIPHQDSKWKKTYENALSNYYQKEEELKNANQELEYQFNEQIMTQLNQYLQDFGKENGYDFIYGTSNGNLMYANEDLNVTQEALKFINRQFEGK